MMADQPVESPQMSYIIVGAGVFGASLAHHLSLAPGPRSTITLIDRGPFPPSLAASTDCNKIVRADYAIPFYMELAVEAINAWKTWPEFSRKAGDTPCVEDDRVYHPTGWISCDQQGSDHAERIRKNFAAREGAEDPTSVLSLDEVKTKYNNVFQDLEVEGFRDAYWNPTAGWADAGEAVAMLIEESVKRGVNYVVGDVETLQLRGEKVNGVILNDGRVLNADKVILATGAWSAKIMSGVEDHLQMEDSMRIQNQLTAAGVCVAHFNLSETEYERLKSMPVFVYGGKGNLFLLSRT
jgi:sarcosine oxidase / L-pipecolate oxidase